MAGSTLPERVAQIYYTYGLFCSSYPYIVLAFACSMMLLCCYPLLNVPLPGNIPTVVRMSPADYIDPHYSERNDCGRSNCQDHDFYIDCLNNATQNLQYVWGKDKPLLYVQQIIMKTAVSPWNENLKMWDAFRGPLQEVFRLLETIRNHEDPESKTTLSSHCYQVDSIKRHQNKASSERVLPEYSCLLLSPANLWHQNLQEFSLDPNIINTIFNNQNLQKTKVSLAEMAFGMQLRDSGIKRYPLRSRPRVLLYAVTIFYQHPAIKFMKSLSKKLRTMYPAHQETPYTHANEITFVYYPGEFNYHELGPLTITFVGLFLYVYFSVRKIEYIKSKLGLAASAIATIAGSLAMSMGICFYFGFSLSVYGKEIYPYLVILVGLENVLVLTKSVTSTDSRLDVKIRLAQGLSKEGWSITKNLLTEITIFTVGFFTFVPFIQEFSIFMIVSLLSDYLIQMSLFATILGIDVQRIEYYQDKSNKLQLKEYFNSYSALNWSYIDRNSRTSQSITKSKSHPRLNGLAHMAPTDVVASRNTTPKNNDDRVPKRIRLVNFWARTRFFQRAFMLWMLVWISMIIYNSGVVEYFTSGVEKADVKQEHHPRAREMVTQKPIFYNFYNSDDMFSPMVTISSQNLDAEGNDSVSLKHSANSRPWSRLSEYHWSSILSQYNESVNGRYVVVLPPTLVSWRVPPELATSLRHPDEKQPPPLRWQALAAALDPIDILPEFDLSDKKGGTQWGKAAELPIYPTTPMEILLLAILCSISVAVIAYMMVVLYRCVCSRNYAEWRASWNDKEEYLKILSKQPAMQLVMEAVPIVVPGHIQEVECLVADGDKVASSCLQGTVKVWDAQNGDLLTNIDRLAFFKLQKEIYEKVNLKRSAIVTAEPISQSDEVSHHSEGVYKLRRGLSNHLSGLRFRSSAPAKPGLQLSAAETTKYDFVKTYRELYYSDEQQREDNLGCESKENIDINNTTDNKNSEKDSDNAIFMFNFNDSECSVRQRNKPKLVSETKKSVHNIATGLVSEENLNWRVKAVSDSPIWCMDFSNDLIVLGCADGRLEFWEATSGTLLCIWWWSGGGECGVSAVRALEGGRRLAAAALGGHLLLLRVSVRAPPGTVAWQGAPVRKTHKRTGSAGCLYTGTSAERHKMNFSFDTEFAKAEEVECSRIAQCRPHQQPINEMQCEGGRILTGGQDHVLKVFSSSDLSPLFTLHGHCGPITSSFIDHATPTIGGSGSQDGLLCVWDLHTGACLYSTQAHDGAVTALSYTASYVVSGGADERLCIWDRFQGHMLNSVHIGLSYMSRMLPLTHSLLLIGDRSGLAVYDLSSGEVIRRVMFGQNDGCVFVRQILPLKDAIVCDYSNQLRIVRFPLVSKLSDVKNE